MSTLILDLLATAVALSYLVYIWSELRRKLEDLQTPNQFASAVLILAFLLHLAYTALIIGVPTALQFSLGSVSVFVALGAIGCTLYLYFTYGYRVIALVTSPLVILVVTATMFFGQGAQTAMPNPLVTTHVFVSLLAYATLVVTAIQALSILKLDRSLKQGDATTFVKLMPPLETVEATAMYLLRFGLGLLTLSVLSGFIMLWQEIQPGRYWTHMGLAVACWVLYTAVVIGQLLFGWRGQTSAKLSLSAFLVLLAGFLGLSVTFGYGA